MKKRSLNLLYLVLSIPVGIIFWRLFLRNTSEVSVQTARENIQAGKYDAIIDVRTKEEWDAGHVTNTISIPIGNLVSELPAKVPDKTTRILFVCKKGIRASGVVEIARKLGYTDVQAMMGSYADLA